MKKKATRRFFFLDSEQRNDLASHLETHLPVNEIPGAVAAIDFACAWAMSEMLMMPGERRRQFASQRKHFERIEKLSADLQTLLGKERPLWNTATIDWKAFDHALAQISNSARIEARAVESTRRGRPSLEWRDRLIATIYSLYPSGTELAMTKGTIGRLFEDTVQLTLEFLGQDEENVHSRIVEVLKRRPAPPFRVDLH